MSRMSKADHRSHAEGNARNAARLRAAINGTDEEVMQGINAPWVTAKDARRMMAATAKVMERIAVAHARRAR